MLPPTKPFLSCLLLLTAVNSSLLAQREIEDSVTRFVTEQTIAVATIRLDRFEEQAIERIFQVIPKRKSQSVPPFDIAQQLKERGVEQLNLFYDISEFPHAVSYAVIALNQNQTNVEKVKEAMKPYFLESQIIDNHLVFSRQELARLQNRYQDERTFARQLSAQEERLIRFVFQPSYAQRKALELVSPNLPQQFGGVPTSTLTSGIKSVAMHLDIAPTLDSQISIQLSGESHAEPLLNWYQGVWKGIKTSNANDAKLMATLEPLFAPIQQGSEIKIRPTAAADFANLLSRYLRQASQDALESTDLSKARQIGIAMLNYESTYQNFPAHASRDANGRPLLSWRVHVLPYLEAGDLYEQFHLDEAWDSPHNRQLVKKMPAIFRASSSLHEVGTGRSNFVAPVGKRTAIGTVPVKANQVKDGTSNTLLLIEVDDSHAPIWTQPEDWNVDEDSLIGGIGQFQENGFVAGFCDASTVILRADLSDDQLRALANRDDGKSLDRSSVLRSTK